MKFVISFDFEMGWGVLDTPAWQRREALGVYDRLRSVLPELVTHLKDRELDSTWAVVANMFVGGIEKMDISHLPDSYKGAIRKFLAESKRSTWDASDLLGVINDQKTIEIATHTATHIYPSHPDCTSDAYLADVSSSLSVLSKIANQKCTSIIYPRDQSDYRLEVASRWGLDSRINPNFMEHSSRLSQTKRFINALSGLVPESRVFIGAHKEIYHTGSILFNWNGRNAKALRRAILKNQIEQVLKAAELKREQDTTIHIWLHPFNLTEDLELKEYFLDTLTKLAKLRDRGRVDVVTMAEVRKALPIG